jgi:hypothetical protein
MSIKAQKKHCHVLLPQVASFPAKFDLEDVLQEGCTKGIVPFFGHVDQKSLIFIALAL